MNLIITAGGTSEKIDQVRKISNMATGKLGCLVAMEFYKQYPRKIDNIFYVCEAGAAVPDLPCVQLIEIAGTAMLYEKLKSLLTQHRIDAAIHSMAVSDYTVKSILTAEWLAKALAEKFRGTSSQEINESRILSCLESLSRELSVLESGGKIPSDVDHMMIALKRTPKIIGLFKEMQPQLTLVGFKLLSGVSVEKLIAAGYGIMDRNSCDFVFANDSENLKNDGQSGYLLSTDRKSKYIEGKENIAKEITSAVLHKLQVL